MPVSTNCPECENDNVYISDEIAAASVEGPNYLPDLGSFWKAPKLHVVVCQDCGLTRFFATKEALAKLPNSAKWRRLNSGS